jgi:quercetin dioxygenase-like cupin family protein
MKTDCAQYSSILKRSLDAAILDVFGTRVTILGGAAETAGAFSLAKVVCPPGTGAPPHKHNETEHFHINRGRLMVRLGDQIIELLPGDTIHIPSGTPHAFSGNSSEETEFLAVASPAGHENFFQAADELSRSGRFNPTTAAELCQKHGITLV